MYLGLSQSVSRVPYLRTGRGLHDTLVGVGLSVSGTHRPVYKRAGAHAAHIHGLTAHNCNAYNMKHALYVLDRKPVRLCNH
jgi:hypothetical protein